MDFLLAQIQANASFSPLREISAIGHRVVQGGECYQQPVIVDKRVIENLEKLAELAPLHNPINLLGIRFCRAELSKIPQVAVFDTAFHHTLPPKAYRYAIPTEYYQRYRVRRYGFHGISHQYVVKRAAEALRIPLAELNVISLHLGAGASATAVVGGKSIDTSMGMTPLAGLMMATRSGDIDPAIIDYLLEKTGMTSAQLKTVLNRESGIQGIAGVGDMQELLKLKQNGEASAVLAYEMFCYQVSKTIGAYYAIMGRVDAVLFTGGIGEHSPAVRRTVCASIGALGIRLDEQKNLKTQQSVSEIQASDSVPKILVIATDEAREIASAVKSCLNGKQDSFA